MSSRSDWEGRESAEAFLRHLFYEDGLVYELRAFGVEGVYGKGIVSGYFDNPEDLLREAAAFDGRAETISVTLNPVNPALLARAKNRVIRNPKCTTSDRDIEQVNWLLIDADPVRPSGIASTDKEMSASFEQLREVGQWLEQMGFGTPLKASSGNGGHACYRLSDPTVRLDDVLKAIAFRFDSEDSVIDQGVGNPARLVRLYGTLNRKGDPTSDRPHRRSRLYNLDADPTPTSAGALEAVASMGPPDAPKPSSTSGRGEPIDVPGFIERHGLEVAREAPWQSGQKWVLKSCPFNSEHDPAAIVQFPSGGVAFRCHHNGCAGNGWRELRAQLEPQPPGVGQKNGTPRGADGQLSPVEELPVERVPFPIHLLPASVQAMARSMASSRAVDLGAVCGVALSALASAIGLSRRYHDDYADWREISVVWIAVVAKSGSRKSAITEDLFAPHVHRQRRLVERFEAERDQYLAEYDAWKERRKGADPADAEPPPTEPQLVHVYTTDSTMEAVVRAMKSSPRGISIVVDELAGFFGSMGKYSGKADADRAFYLSMFRGVPYKKDRASGDTVFIECMAGGIVGSVQPSILRACFNEQAISSGLAARFGLVMLSPQVKQYGRGPSQQIASRYAGLIEKLFSLRMDQVSGEQGQIVERPLDVRITSEAREIVREFVPDWSSEGMLESPDVEAAMSKLEAYALRFALIRRCCREAGGECVETDPITADDIKAGIEIARWFRIEATAIYQQLRQSGAVDERGELLARVAVIRDMFGGSVTESQWHRRNRRRSREAASRELNELVAEKLAEWRDEPAGRGGGRPTRRCVIVEGGEPTTPQPDPHSPEGVSGIWYPVAGGGKPGPVEGGNAPPGPEKGDGTEIEANGCYQKPPSGQRAQEKEEGDRGLGRLNSIHEGALPVDGASEREYPPGTRYQIPETPSGECVRGDSPTPQTPAVPETPASELKATELDPFVQLVIDTFDGELEDDEDAQGREVRRG